MRRAFAGILRRPCADPLASWRAGEATLSHLGAAAAATLLLALVGVSDEGATAAAIALLVAGVVLAPVIALSLLVVAAHVPALLETAALDPLSAVDLLLLAILLRTTPQLLRCEPGRGRRAGPVLVGLVLVAGGVATAIAPDESAVTAFMRLATYLAVGTVAVLHRSAAEIDRILATMVGVAAGDSLGAIMHITPTIETGLPVGRYVGTLGDPSQFGIAVAIALLLVIAAPRLVPLKARWILMAVLAVALLGSGTRAAWAAFVVGFVVWCAFLMVRRNLPWRWRFASGLAVGGALVAALAAVTVAAPQLGLQAGSISVRTESQSVAAEYLAAHPLQPLGLGNAPGVIPTYNTWLALAIALGLPTMLLFAAYVGLTLRRAVRCAAPALTAVLVGVLATTPSENLLFAGSSLTLTWVLLLGMATALPLPARADTDGASPASSESESSRH